MSSLRFIDLFSGIGGIRLAMENAGYSCVFSCEINPQCCITYRKNFSDTSLLEGDITSLSSQDIPDHDILCAGFPCQPFSLAGVSKRNSLGIKHGFRCEDQGILFYHLARIISDHRPKAFLLENVKNLIHHDGGRTFSIIQNTLQTILGYSIYWKVIDSSAWVPQKRQRIFIVGFRDQIDFSFENMILNLPKKKPILKSVLESGEVDQKYILSQHLWNYLRKYKIDHANKGNGFGYSLVGPNDVARTLSSRYGKDGSEILIKRGKIGSARPRMLTPRECSRLMGFETKTSKKWKIPVSDCQAWKQFGNSVVIPVVTAVARHAFSRIC